MVQVALTPLNILIVSETWHPQPDSAATHLAERAELWVAEGHTVSVIAGSGPPSAHNGVRISRTHPKRLHRGSSLLSRYLQVGSFGRRAAAMSILPPDVILTSSPPLAAANAGCQLAMQFNVPHVVELRDLWPDSVRELAPMGGWPLIRSLEKAAIRVHGTADQLIAVSEEIADQTRRTFHPTATIHVIPTGAGKSFAPRPKDHRLRRLLGIRDEHVVGYLGTIGRAQDVAAIVEAATRLNAKGVSVLICGGGAPRQETCV